MHISTTASPTLTGSKEEILLQKCPSDVLWYFFLVVLLSLLLLAQPDQRQSTMQKRAALITGNMVMQTDKPVVTASR